MFNVELFTVTSIYVVTGVLTIIQFFRVLAYLLMNHTVYGKKKVQLAYIQGETYTTVRNDWKLWCWIFGLIAMYSIK